MTGGNSRAFKHQLDHLQSEQLLTLLCIGKINSATSALILMLLRSIATRFAVKHCLSPAPSNRLVAKSLAFSRRMAMNLKVPTGLPLSTMVKKLEDFAPSWLAESWDNVGLLLEPTDDVPVMSLLLTNDLTEDVMDEAISLGVQLILSYHPPLFKSIKTITNKHWKTRIVSKCLRNSIAVYSPHTSYDSVSGGVNDWLAGAFDFASKYPITPAAQPPAGPCNLELEKCGAGRLLTLSKPITIAEAVQNVKSHLAVQHVHLALQRNATTASLVQTVALCAGSGSSVLAGVKADLLLTGEMSHHEVLEAVHQGSSVLLTWHSTSERGFLKQLARQLEDQMLVGTGVTVHVSQQDKEPICTL
ncbi:hypothetical protein B566_EDAN002721 [Ephemera danica]|nr:hypothetical protein B566_EDAN002721 [Ephemera danica]